MDATPRPTVDPRGAAHFGALAGDWWDPKGRSAMLHRLNPARLAYIRARLDEHFGLDPRERAPLAGKRALDMGCGGGLLAEPLARLGADVVAVDAAAEAVAVGRAHAERGGLAIDFRVGGVEAAAGERFDLVTSLEVIEHAADQAAFVRGLVRALADGGLMILSTPNRTALSRAAMIGVGEGLHLIPPGTHDWRRFVTPDELEGMLAAEGLRVVDRTGLTLSPTKGFVLSDDLSLDYLVTAIAEDPINASPERHGP